MLRKHALSKIEIQAQAWFKTHVACGIVLTAQRRLTIEEIALGFQDLNNVIDPSPADLRRGGLQLEAHYAPIGVARCQREAGIVAVHAGLHPQAAHLERITSD